MSNEEKILQLLESQQEAFRKISGRLDEVKSRLSGIDSRLDKLEESAEITRSGVNSLLQWAEHVSNAISFPLPKVE